MASGYYSLPMFNLESPSSPSPRSWADSRRNCGRIGLNWGGEFKEEPPLDLEYDLEWIGRPLCEVLCEEYPRDRDRVFLWLGAERRDVVEGRRELGAVEGVDRLCRFVLLGVGGEG